MPARRIPRAYPICVRLLSEQGAVKTKIVEPRVPYRYVGRQNVHDFPRHKDDSMRSATSNQHCLPGTIVEKQRLPIQSLKSRVGSGSSCPGLLAGHSSSEADRASVSAHRNAAISHVLQTLRKGDSVGQSNKSRSHLSLHSDAHLCASRHESATRRSLAAVSINSSLSRRRSPTMTDRSERHVWRSGEGDKHGLLPHPLQELPRWE